MGVSGSELWRGVLTRVESRGIDQRGLAVVFTDLEHHHVVREIKLGMTACTCCCCRCERWLILAGVCALWSSIGHVKQTRVLWDDGPYCGRIKRRDNNHCCG